MARLGTRNTGDDGQREHDQGEKLWRAKAQGEACQHPGKQDQRDVRDHVSRAGGIKRDIKRLSRLTLLRQWIAIEDRTGGRGRAWCFDQDRRQRTTVKPALIDPKQQQDAGDRIKRKGKGQDKRHTHRRGHPRDRANDRADQHANPDDQDVLKP